MGEGCGPTWDCRLCRQGISQVDSEDPTVRDGDSALSDVSVSSAGSRSNSAADAAGVLIDGADARIGGIVALLRITARDSRRSSMPFRAFHQPLVRVVLGRFAGHRLDVGAVWTQLPCEAVVLQIA